MPENTRAMKKTARWLAGPAGPFPPSLVGRWFHGSWWGSSIFGEDILQVTITYPLLSRRFSFSQDGICWFPGGDIMMQWAISKGVALNVSFACETFLSSPCASELSQPFVTHFPVHMSLLDISIYFSASFWSFNSRDSIRCLPKTGNTDLHYSPNYVLDGARNCRWRGTKQVAIDSQRLQLTTGNPCF